MAKIIKTPILETERLILRPVRLEDADATLIRTEKQKWRGENREMEIWELTAESWKEFKKKDS